MNAKKELSLDESGARKKIMEAAILLFATKGLHGTSTREIAKKSGLNLSLISYYFGGKEGLYRTVIQEFAQHVFGQIERVVVEFEQQPVTEHSFRRTLKTLINTIIDMRMETPHMAKILTREKIAGMPYSREVHETIMSNAGLKLESIILRGKEAGFIQPNLNSAFVVICLVESMMGYFNTIDCHGSWNEKLFDMKTQRDEFAEHILTLFLRGILK